VGSSMNLDDDHACMFGARASKTKIASQLFCSLKPSLGIEERRGEEEK
jgi:hypothetical protein